MGTQYQLIVLAACGLITGLSVPVSAALLCDTASMSAMEQPPTVRMVTVNVPNRPQQIAYISVTARGADVATVSYDRAPVAPLATRDAANPDGVRVFPKRGLAPGVHEVMVTYTGQPSADAISVLICDGVKPGAPDVKGLSMVPTGDRREILTVTGDDDVDGELRFVGSSAGRAEISIEAPGGRFFSRGAAVTP